MYRLSLHRMANISEKKFQKKNQNIFYVQIFFLNRPVLVEKYCTAREATYDNMAHAHCMLDN